MSEKTQHLMVGENIDRHLWLCGTDVSIEFTSVKALEASESGVYAHWLLGDEVKCTRLVRTADKTAAEEEIRRLLVRPEGGAVQREREAKRAAAMAKALLNEVEA